MAFSPRVLDIAFWASAALGAGAAVAVAVNATSLYRSVHQARAEVAASQQLLVKTRADTDLAVTQAQSAKKDAATATAELGEINKQAADARAAIDTRAAVLRDLDTKIGDRNKKQETLAAAIRTRTGELAGLDNQYAAKKATADALDRDVASDTARVAELKDRFAQLAARLQQTQSQIDGGAAKLRQIEDALQRADQQIAEKRDILRRLDADIASHPRPAPEASDNFCPALRRYRAANPQFDALSFCKLAPAPATKDDRSRQFKQHGNVVQPAPPPVIH